MDVNQKYLIGPPESRGDFPAGTLADAYHRADLWKEIVEDMLMDRLCEIFGRDKKRGPWPCQDIRCDPYDSSLEMLDCDNDLTVSPEQAFQIREMGYSRFWANFSDGTEISGCGLRRSKSTGLPVGDAPAKEDS